MSVVNKMLQDLEARKNAPEMISADYVPLASSKRNVWVIVLIILVLAMAAYLWLIGPQKTPNSLDATNIVEVKTSGQQANSQTNRPDLEKNINVERELSKDNNLAGEPIVSTTNTPDETIKEHTVTEPIPVKIVPLLRKQAIVDADTKQALTQVANLGENIVENTDKKQPQAESRFSISDSTEKNKVAGAKQSVINALSEGDNGLAIRRLEELLRVQPANIEARKKLAAILFAEKRSKQAEHVLLQGINKHPQRSDLRLMMARLYMQRKDNKAAIQLLSEVEPDTANKMEFLAYRAALLQQNAHYEPAMTDYINLLEADSTNSKWWLGLAITQDRLGQTNEALSAYRSAFNKEQLSPSVIKFVEQRMSQIEGAR
jgi:MSHA biogenesis protein MshN